jgi:hypothetical protein
MPVSVAFDGVDTLYFTSLDPDLFIPVDCNNPPPNETCDNNFAGRVWSIKTDGTGLTTVANLPGGVPRFGGEPPRNILALAYDSSRDGLWVSVNPVNEIHLLDLSTGQFSFRFDAPGQAAGVWNAPDGLAHDPDTDTLFLSAFDGLTIFQTDPVGNVIREFFLNTLPGGNNGMAWDGEKLWLARTGSVLGGGFIGTFDANPLLPAGTEREGGPTFSDAGAPNDLAFDSVTFSPSCALWATSTDGRPTLHAYDIPCPTGEATDITPPTATCGEPTPPGSLEPSFQDLESGLAQLFLIGDPRLRNADVSIPPFVEGTRSMVIVTVTRIDHDLESRVALRGVDVRGNARNIGCIIPAGVIGPDPCEGLGGDTDGDGVCNADDNCPDDANADQADSDGDGTGDACEAVPGEGDLDGDGDVDRDDMNIMLSFRNQSASNCPECDLDGDGLITVLDVRKLILKCTRPRCATQ